MAKKRRKANSFTLAYITCPTRSLALKLGRLFVTKRLAGCANILPHMQSCYVWEGKLETTTEAVLLLKTTQRLKGKILAEMNHHHPYSVPCVLFFKLEGGNPKYLNWLAQNVRSALK